MCSQDRLLRFWSNLKKKKTRNTGVFNIGSYDYDQTFKKHEIEVFSISALTILIKLKKNQTRNTGVLYISSDDFDQNFAKYLKKKPKKNKTYWSSTLKM